MRIKEGFILRETARQAVIIAVGETSKEFHKVINLNCTAKDIWKGLEACLDEEEIAQKLVQDYDVDIEKARTDVKVVLARFVEVGICET